MAPLKLHSSRHRFKSRPQLDPQPQQVLPSLQQPLLMKWDPRGSPAKMLPCLRFANKLGLESPRKSLQPRE